MTISSSKAKPSEMNPTSMTIKKNTKRKRKPGRRTRRTKTRKLKYLSLRLQFPSEKYQQSSDRSCSTVATTSNNKAQNQQLNLFPLHPENLVEEKDTGHDENMAYLLSAADGGATSLTGLLGAAPSTSCSDEDNKRDESMELSASALELTALRSKERDASEERYVRYSEVTSSCHTYVNHVQRRLSLKLDYEEILNAWSDKGRSLYIRHAPAADQSPQTVPDFHDDIHNPDPDDFLTHEICNGLWSVPDVMRSKGGNGGGAELRLMMNVHDDQSTKGMRILGQREASVLRYKEKRQNRLFSKRIRYQVRKLNAEKRPRVKGRFVKRN